MKDLREDYGIIFGATGLLGSKIALQLTKLNANLILHGRSLEKLKFLKEDVGLSSDDFKADDHYAIRSAAQNGHVHVLEQFKDEVGLTADDFRGDDDNNKEITNNYKPNTLKENYKKILTALIPIIPHFSSECLEMMNEEASIVWPTYDEKLLEEKNSDIVVQINGKKRGLINIRKDIDQKELFEIILNNKNLYKYLENKEIKKNIYIKNKLINIII